MSVGANIKKRRYELRMTQQELAEAMGYKTRSTIAKIESGKNDVSQKKLQKFASVLDISPENLISGYTPSINTPANAGIQPRQRKNKNVVIILAGGKSGRNQQNIPSQFINIHDKPILVYSMEVYQDHPDIDDIYVVSLKGWADIVQSYARTHKITKLKGLFLAGSSGIRSLKNAFDFIKTRYAPEDIVVIQESTRPLINAQTVSKLLQVCEETGSATICHSMKDYVQFTVSEGKTKYVDRENVIALQSPEAHKFALLAELFKRVDRSKHPLTESCCTMLLYNLGYPINFIEGGFNNIKIVREEDIATFGALVKR